MKTKKRFLSLLLSVVACVAVCFSIGFTHNALNNKIVKAASYKTKDIAMLGSVAGWHGNGNFEIRFTLGEADWTNDDAGKKSFDTKKGLGDLPTLLKNLDFFNHVKMGDKTLAEWGCTTCYDNAYWLNDSEPDYTLMIPLSMDSANMSTASSAGIGGGTRVTILEGALLPSYAYLQGNASATVYRAGCDFVTFSEPVAGELPYGIYAIGKTDVARVTYVQQHDGSAGYFGVSLKGDDYLGDGSQAERSPNYDSFVYADNQYPNKITVDGVAGKAESYGLFNLGTKGKGYYAFTMRVPESDMESITIPAGTTFPSRAMLTLRGVNNGNRVYIFYQTQTDVTFYKQPDGTWAETVKTTNTSVESVEVPHGDANYPTDNFLMMKLSTNDYVDTLSDYTGNDVSVREFLTKHDSYSKILINGSPATAGEAFINVWSRKGIVAIRTNMLTADVTKVTILAGCKFPTFYALYYGVNEAFITTEDITFVKNGDVWEKYILEGDFNTSVTKVQFGRSTNVINIELSANDYPSPNINDNATFNLGIDPEKILSLNLFDNIIVDGYTLRSRYNSYGDARASEPWIWINKFVGHNFAVTVPNVDENQPIVANKIVIRAGTQFPSSAYVNGGAQAFYVTTEEVTYVRISDDNEANWAKQSNITFVADGKTVATRKYTKEQGIDGDVPYVPDKEGYKGVWESYTLNGEDLVVNAKYVAHSFAETETNVSKFEYREAFILLYLTTSDYKSAGYTLDVKDRMSTLHFFDFLEIDGKMVAEAPTGIHGAYINVWGNTEGAFATYIPGGVAPTNKVVIKKGAQIPSNAYRLDENNKTCFVVKEDVTFIKEGDVWVRQSNGDSEVVSMKPTYDNNYVLSDLYNTGYSKSAELEKGYIEVDDNDVNIRGYNVSNSFSLTFDFSLNIGDNDVAGLGNYSQFSVVMATSGWNGGDLFGWRFYLYRPNVANKCVEFYCSKSQYNDDYNGRELKDGEDPNPGNIAIFEYDDTRFEKGKTYRITIGFKILDESTATVETYLNIDGTEKIERFVLGEPFMDYAPYVDGIRFTSNTAIENGVRLSDPGIAYGEENHTINFVYGQTQILSDKANVYELPTLSANEYGKKGDVFVGWTTDLNTLSTLYPAGYELKLTGDITLYPVWINFNLRQGAGVRKTGESGIRFLVDVDGKAYSAWSANGLILGSGTLVVPTSYLDSGRAFIHESFPTGYFVDVPTETWIAQSGDVHTFAAALVNISPAQYARSMSARGYLKIKFSDGSVGYIYTPYSKDLHARSIYEVATKAYAEGYTGDAVTNYLNNVADVVINQAFILSKNQNAKGNYDVSCEKTDLSYTVTVDKAVKTVVINGVRMVAGYGAEVIIANKVYSISGYKLNTNGLTFTFTVESGNDVDYYSSLVEYYANSSDYTELHKKQILAIIAEWGGDYSNADINAENLEKLESIKTAVELKNDVGETQLVTPVVTYGLGYSATWEAVPNADYYFVTDDNDYRNGVYVTTNSYRPEVVGKHNITVTAYSYSEEYKTSETSSSFATLEIKPVFAYKSMNDGLYKFTSAQLKTLGISDDIKKDCYVDKKNTSKESDDEYFLYYNKKFNSWSANEANGTDWASPAEFPDHAQKLKDLGLNIILIPEGNSSTYKSTDVWQTSRLKYVMDTAWSIGMKVIVCEDALYTASKNTSSKNDFKNTINASTGFKYYVKHPAFYGFSLEDEPSPTGSQMKSVGYAVQALKEVCANDYGLSKANGNEPFFLACLYQKSSGFDIGSIVGIKYDEYVSEWFSYTNLDYVYVDLYTGHAMGDNTNRYATTYEVLYGEKGTGGVVTGTAGRKFYQVITAHTQSKDKDGVLTEQDLYMSMLYAAAHNVSGYSWFCYFPIVAELAGSMVGFDGEGYGNGNGLNGAEERKSYYATAQKANYQFELIQGLLNGYSFVSRSYKTDLLTTTLSNGTRTATFYVNADTQSLSAKPSVTASGTECYLVGDGLNSDYYKKVISGTTIELQPGQALICLS